jgi:hypothetical protein
MCQSQNQLRRLILQGVDWLYMDKRRNIRAAT